MKYLLILSSLVLVGCTHHAYKPGDTIVYSDPSDPKKDIVVTITGYGASDQYGRPTYRVAIPGQEVSNWQDGDGTCSEGVLNAYRSVGEDMASHRKATK